MILAWQIEASKGYFDGLEVEGLHIAYGDVPPDYKQVVPTSSQGVPSLRPDVVVYGFFAEMTGAAATRGAFHVDKSGEVQVVDTDLCSRMHNATDIRINCKTDEPYQEPSDIRQICERAFETSRIGRHISKTKT